MKYCVVVHYSEIGLKGKNRGQFEEQLRYNIQLSLKGLQIQSVQRTFGRLLILLPDCFDWPKIRERLQTVFGIAHFSLAMLTDQDMEHIQAAAMEQMSAKEFKSFRVTTKRAQKEFPLNSSQVNAQIGAAIQQQTGAQVNLNNPEVTCYIEIFNKNALIYSEKVPGLRGLPSGISEKAVSLLSSGIDSPVASWKIMKRGVRVIFVHFHSVPATSEASIENTKRIVEILTRYQYKSKLYLVPFLNIQQQIMIGAPPKYRVLLYRRSMFRLAERIATIEKANALVTGENVAQVASQTLSNIRSINDAVCLPVLRPLAGEDKLEITELAQKIGTFEISIEPYEDCCSLYVPQHPAIYSSPEKLQSIEDSLKLDSFYEEALEKTQIIKFKYFSKKL